MASRTYTVEPIPNSSRWRVLSNGTQISKHNKKSNAIERAKEVADRNDTITVKGRDGRFQRQVTPT